MNISASIHDTDNNKQATKILYWHRYVDDILCLYNGNTRQITQLHNHINKLHPKLKFTLETETNNSLNFLDITITKLDNTHNFKIYRKPTTTVSVIHNTSNHPIQHKHAAFHSMINRLTRIPMKDNDYNNELNIIKYIAQENGYNPEIIDRILKNNKHRQTLNTQKTLTPHNKYITLTYHNQNTQKIATKFKKLKYNMIGVYKLKCCTCPQLLYWSNRQSISNQVQRTHKCTHKNTHEFKLCWASTYHRTHIRQHRTQHGNSPHTTKEPQT